MEEAEGSALANEIASKELATRKRGWHSRRRRREAKYESDPPQRAKIKQEEEEEEEEEEPRFSKNRCCRGTKQCLDPDASMMRCAGTAKAKTIRQRVWA